MSVTSERELELKKRFLLGKIPTNIQLVTGNRKFQKECEQTFRKIHLGIEEFESKMEKVIGSKNPSHREKHEGELKKEIKKLQRLREVVKNWLNGNDFKDKRLLFEYRKMVEQRMELFKESERKTKMKTFSNVALNMQKKSQKKQLSKEMQTTKDWIEEFLGKIETSLKNYEKELETLYSQRKPDQDEIETLEEHVERSRLYYTNLKLTEKLLDEKKITIEDVEELKDGIEYYAEEHSEPNFVYDEFLFEDIETKQDGPVLDEVEKKVVEEVEKTMKKVLKKKKDLKNSTSNEDLRINRAIKTVKKKDKKKLTKKELKKEKKLKKKLQREKEAREREERNRREKEAREREKQKKLKKLKEAREREERERKSKKRKNSQNNPESVWNTTKKKSTKNSRKVSKNNVKRGKDNEEVLNSIMSRRLMEEEKLKKLKMMNKSHYEKKKSIVESSIKNTHNVPDMLPVINKPRTSRTIKTTTKTTTKEVDLKDKEKLERIALEKELEGMEIIIDKLHFGMKHLPKTNDVINPRKVYKPITRKRVPDCFPQELNPMFNNPDFFHRLDLESLFFAFYFQKNTYRQILAAKALKGKCWRFHKKHHLWFQRHHSPTSSSDVGELGTFIYFDIDSKGWCPRIKKKFLFKYMFLEKEV